jgi:hypothetical protein
VVLLALAVVATIAAAAAVPAKGTTTYVRGTPRTPPRVPTARNGDPLLPFYNDSGLISLSVDAAGTNDPAGTLIKVHKNIATATVRKAFLFAASTGFSGYTPVTGDVTLDGTSVAWNPANTISNDISSVNVEADVTSIVAPIVNAAPAGDVSFTVAEPLHPFQMDGEILAVILNDPSVTTSGSVTLLYGAQNPAGDTFNVALANPVDKTDPNFAMNLSLGISFGYQLPSGTGQFSTVDVNGTRMTSSAGGQDDCVAKYSATPNFGACANGELITAGGIGDTNANPANPLDTGTCATSPRCDDELYNLLPFLNNGDTSLTFKTTNPSNDDNIFFAALDTRASAAVVGEGVVLSPTSATNNVGQPHTVTATVQDNAGHPIANTTVTFTVTSGPNAGLTGTATTDASGKASFTYTSSVAGTDSIVASFTDPQGVPHTSNTVTKTWLAGDATPPSCTLTNVIAGPPKQIQITVSDSGSGLGSVQVTTSTNATTAVPAFTPGDTSPLVVTSTKIDQSLGSVVALQVTDVAGNVTNCDPVFATLRAHSRLTVRRYTGLARHESKVTLRNGTPGVRSFELIVNGHVYRVGHLRSGQLRKIDVAKAMRSGSRNVVVARALGKRGSSITIAISD